jgi:dTDP-4-dehydrorhamnose reductase
LTRPRALITGATGLLGSAILPDLESAWDCVPVGHTRRPAHPRGAVVDLGDAAATAACVQAARPDVILHLAALADVDACERTPELAWLRNVVATRNVMRAAGEATLVYVSTDQLYDADGANRENAPRPRNTYSLTKLWGEDVALEAKKAIVLRLNFVATPIAGRPGFAGWLVDQLRSGRPVNVFNDVFFNPTYGGFVGQIVVDLVQKGARGVFNLGAALPGISKAEFAQRVARRFGYPAALLRETSVTGAPLAAYRPRGMTMDVHKLTGFLRRPMPSIDDCIAALHTDWVRHGFAA